MKTTWIVLAVAAGAVAPAWAIRVGNETTPVDTGKALQTASPVAAGAAASHADDSTSMRQGMINSVNASRDGRGGLQRRNGSIRSGLIGDLHPPSRRQCIRQCYRENPVDLHVMTPSPHFAPHDATFAARASSFDGSVI